VSVDRFAVIDMIASEVAKPSSACIRLITVSLILSHAGLDYLAQRRHDIVLSPFGTTLAQVLTMVDTVEG
jgi:hypothetical protein